MSNFSKRVLCLLSGGHKQIYLGSSLPFYQASLFKCPKCGKYYYYHNGINCGFWTFDIKELPKEIQEHIIKHNL